MSALADQNTEGIVRSLVDEDKEACISELAKSCVLKEDGLHSDRSSDSPANDNTCAICLNHIAGSETAQPDCCEHIYCTCCLLHWAVYKERPWCPQCKLPFSSMLTFRTLDGNLHDYPCKESIGLLKRAHWFQDHLKKKEQAIAEAMLPESVRNRAPEGSVIDENDYQDYARYYEEYDDDEEVADYYFSSAAGRARVSIGNRRHGPNGFMSSGRMRARPTPPPAQAKGNGKGSAIKQRDTPSAKGKQSSPMPASNPKSATPGKKKSAYIGQDYEDDMCGSPSTGRRARRNQRKAAADAKAGSWV